jgi:hypothetical protein
VVTHEPIELGQLVLGHRANRTTHVVHGRVRETVVHEEPFLAGLDKSRLPQGLQVL